MRPLLLTLTTDDVATVPPTVRTRATEVEAEGNPEIWAKVISRDEPWPILDVA